MVSASIALEKITNSFKSSIYPGDLNIVNDYGYHYENSESAEVQKIFAGKHWNQCDLETLMQNNSAHCFMTIEAFRFYLPAYMSIIIKEYEHTDIVRDGIVSQLTLPIEVDNSVENETRQYISSLMLYEDKTEDLRNTLTNSEYISSLMLYGDKTEGLRNILTKEISRCTERVHRFIEIMFGFNQEQSQAIRYFLEYLNSEKKDDFFGEPQEAIHRYWFIFP